MSSRSAVLVESVAQALTWAINDPLGHHSSWTTSVAQSKKYFSSPCFSKPRRSAEDTRRAAAVFDSSAIPPIGIDKYLLRLSASFRCSDATFIAALIVVDRLIECHGGYLQLTMRNVHRIFLASLVVAVKYHEDLVYSNSHYAKAGGVQLREVNRLERVALATLDFDLRVESEQYKIYEAALLRLCNPKKEVRATNCSSTGEPQKPAEVHAETTAAAKTAHDPETPPAPPCCAAPALAATTASKPAAGNRTYTGRDGVAVKPVLVPNPAKRERTRPNGNSGGQHSSGYPTQNSWGISSNTDAAWCTQAYQESDFYNYQQQQQWGYTDMYQSDLMGAKDLVEGFFTAGAGDPSAMQKTCSSYATPSQHSMMGIDMAVMVAAAAGDGVLWYPGPAATGFDMSEGFAHAA